MVDSTVEIPSHDSTVLQSLWFWFRCVGHLVLCINCTLEYVSAIRHADARSCDSLQLPQSVQVIATIRLKIQL